MSMENLEQNISPDNSSAGVPPEQDESNQKNAKNPDLLALFIYCRKHKKIPLVKIENYVWWLPNRQMFGTIEQKSLKTAFEDQLKRLFNPDKTKFSEEQLVQKYQVQTPDNHSFSIYFFKTKVQSGRCCESTSEMRWCSLDNLENSSDLWGPEPLLLLQQTVQRELNNLKIQNFNFEEIKESARSDESGLLKAAEITEKKLENLFDVYLNHCYPSIFMTLFSFKMFFHQLNWNVTDEESRSLFRAFNTKVQGYDVNWYLDFWKLLIGLAAMEPATSHEGVPGYLRCCYIFRYYDSNLDGRLTIEDIVQIKKDIAKVNKLENKEAESEAKVIMKNNYEINCNSFINAIRSGEFQGTSDLFRLQKNIFDMIKKREVKTIVGLGPIFNMHYEGVCKTCKKIKYQLAQLSFILSTSGQVKESVNLTELSGFKDVINEFNRKTKTEENKRIYLAERVLRNVKDHYYKSINEKLIYNKGKEALANYWFFKSKKDRNDMIKQLFKYAEEILENEPQMLKIESPVFIFGDIHGNFHDLLRYQELFWPNNRFYMTSNILFLGDYVDRGSYSVETVCYLLAMKVRWPKRWFLVRGNHELRKVQLHMITLHQKNYWKECVAKFGEKIGKEMWELSNQAFDVMPVCATINDEIFCCHGGIPRKLTTGGTLSTELVRIPKRLRDPPQDCPLVQELLWNDPTEEDSKEFQESVGLGNQLKEGFIFNVNRNTGYYFLKEAADRFFSTNKISHLIRAHSSCDKGYNFNFKGSPKVITVFSSSKYNFGSNLSACLLVDQHMIRVLQISK